jgi:hypothetical protein
MKKLPLIMAALFLASTGAMAGDFVKWEKESRNAVPHPRKQVPKAEALVIRANSLLKGNPTCEQMRQAAELLARASDMYVRANVFDGGVRLVARRAAWLQGPTGKGPRGARNPFGCRE